jgi:hypothetical protein
LHFIIQQNPGMNLFVKGIQFRNKGAHLMLQAVREETARWPVPVGLATNPRIGTRMQRRGAGLMDHAWFESPRFPALGPASASMGNLLPHAIRRRADVVADKEITGVLDASGFSYSDQWGAAGVERMVHRCRWWKRRNLPIVLLPQAFGPFTSEKIRQSFRDLAGLVDLIYLRDEYSAAHVRDLKIAEDKLRLAPDFTCLVDGVTRPDHEPLFGRPCLIPNYRMVDKTNPDVAIAYIVFLVACARACLDDGLDPFMLIHDQGRDQEIVGAVEQRLERSLTTVVEDDPVIIKGLVGKASFVVGSRFHGLMSALTQGVACVGTSWSHKYESLFRAFECEHLLVPRTELGNSDALRAVMGAVLDADRRQQWMQRARLIADDHAARTREMWREVRGVFGVPESVFDKGYTRDRAQALGIGGETA